MTDPRTDRRAWLLAGLVSVVAVAVRLIRYRQSLWGDELDTLLNFVVVPWHTVVAAGPGVYTTNNHVLYSLLAKACVTLGGGDPLGHVGRTEMLVRLPSLVAGSLVPVAIAWPMRRTAPALALATAAIADVHPWLVAQSNEARGYALMVLLGVLATHALPDGRRRWPVAYAALVAAMLYTVPVAGLLLIAHGVIVVLRRRAALASWLRGAIVGGLIATALYLPLAAGVLWNYRHPPAGPSDYGDFVNQLFRFAMAGRYLPADDDPTRHTPDPWVGVGYWLAPVALLVAGTIAGRRQPAVRPMLAVTAAATAVALVAPAFAPQAVQVRYTPWCGVWLTVAVAALVVTIGRRFGRPVGWTAAACVVGWMAVADCRMPPDQPVREAILLADRSAPPGSTVVIAFLTAPDAARVYGPLVTAHRRDVVNGPWELPPAEARAVAASGRRPWLVVSYEYLLRDSGSDAWRYLNRYYQLVARLPGRISPVAVYAPR